MRILENIFEKPAIQIKQVCLGCKFINKNGCMKWERHESLFASILFLTHWNIPVSDLNCSLGTNWVNKINMTIWCHLGILAFYKRDCLVE